MLLQKVTGTELRAWLLPRLRCRDRLKSALLFRILILVFAILIPSQAIGSDRVLIFAPTSVFPVLQILADEYEANTGKRIVVSTAATSQLARQLDAGAPADIFVSADDVWMNWVIERNLIQSRTLTHIAKNRLVVAVRRETENWIDWKRLLTDQRFAMSEASSVPAGRYAKQALEHFKLWEHARGSAVFGENARVTLSMLARGDFGAAIVYQSDLELEPNVRAAFLFPDKSHADINVSAALTPSASPVAADFLASIESDESWRVIKKAGFLISEQQRERREHR